MDSTVIAALVAAQAPDHVACRAQDLVEFDAIDSTVVLQCACNVRLTLAVPKAAAPEPVKASKAPKVAGDGS